MAVVVVVSRQQTNSTYSTLYTNGTYKYQESSHEELFEIHRHSIAVENCDDVNETRSTITMGG
jgi:hypothetical protein